MQKGILNCVKVIDLGRYIAGPYAAWLLASLGAEVIRGEKIGGSEDRFVSPLYFDDNGHEGDGALFYQNNSHKKIIGLNPKTKEGKAIQTQLIKSADVVHIMANSGWSWHLFAAPAIMIARLYNRPVVINYRGGYAQDFFDKSWFWVHYLQGCLLRSGVHKTV